MTRSATFSAVMLYATHVNSLHNLAVSAHILTLRLYHDFFFIWKKKSLNRFASFWPQNQIIFVTIVGIFSHELVWLAAFYNDRNECLIIVFIMHSSRSEALPERLMHIWFEVTERVRKPFLEFWHFFSIKGKSTLKENN